MSREMPSPAACDFSQAMDRDDLSAARRVLQRHPQVATNPIDAAFLMHHAAGEGKTAFVALLHEHGADVNIPRSPEAPQRPIWPAVVHGETETVRWLIEHGSDINYGWGGEQSSCVPLATAIRERYDEIVHLLVEAGADLLAKDRNNLLPLDWAHGLGRTAIADYLRSKGGKLSSELPGYVPPPPPPKGEIVQYAEFVLGDTQTIPYTPVLPEAVPVAIHGQQGDPCVLFTQGMYEHAMTEPPGGEDYRHAELLVQFPFDLWPQDDDWTRDECRWLVHWLHRVAQLPFETNTWLGGKWGVISNEEPPQPLSAFTPMTCWLLLAEKGPLTRITLDGRPVVFYTMLPIHTAERDFALREGIVPLLEKFAENDVPDYVVPDRPSVV